MLTHQAGKTHRPAPLAKDAWMLGIGLSLLIDALTDRPRRPD
jgi:hypothetical protein